MESFPTGTSDWYEGTGWSLGNGYAESDGTNAPLDQYNALEIGKQYIVVITVTGMTASRLSVRLGTSSSDQVLQIPLMVLILLMVQQVVLHLDCVHKDSMVK